MDAVVSPEVFLHESAALPKFPALIAILLKAIQVHFAATAYCTIYPLP